MSNVAFIGLGVMGYPMAGYISKAGHNVTVYNRTAAKADKWVAEYKGSKADTPAKAAEGADFIFTCVGNDENLREVSLGENGLFNTAKKDCVYVDNSTVSAEISRELYAAAKEKGFGFLDAPISGGQAGAEGGILTVMVGGDEDVFKKAEEVIDCYSRKVKLIGKTGSASSQVTADARLFGIIIARIVVIVVVIVRFFVQELDETCRLLSNSLGSFLVDAKLFGRAKFFKPLADVLLFAQIELI